jgi:hypothetical protein
MLFLLLIFGLLVIYGGYSVLKGTRDVRKPRRYDDALFAWSERPGQTFKYDFSNWLGISIHRAALVLIAVLALVTMLVQPNQGFGLPGLPNYLILVLDLLVYFAVALLGTGCGFSLFGPVADLLGGDHHYALSDAGILLANQLIPWSAFSHFESDLQRGVIYLWSASLPASVGLAAIIPSSEDLLKLSGLLHQHLPAAGNASSGLFGRYAFPVRMAVACASFILAAGLLYLAPWRLAVILDALLMWVLMWLGAALINLWIYGNHTRPIVPPPAS